MSTSDRLKQQHECAVAQRFLALFNPHFERSLRLERSGKPPEPDVVCTDGSTPPKLIGIEVTTTYLEGGQAFDTIEDAFAASANASSAKPMGEAKWQWNQARGKATPPVWATDGVQSQPDQMQLQILERAIESKLDNSYDGCVCYSLVADWQYYAIDNTVLEDVKAHFRSNEVRNSPFHEIWILCRLGSEMGREAIVKVFPEIEGPFLAPVRVLK